MKRRWLVLLILLALTAIAFARPGGGESFSGGGGGGGGGGDGGILDVLELIFWLIGMFIDYPKTMLTLTVIGIIAVIWSQHQQNANHDWDSGPPVSLGRRAQQRSASAIPLPPASTAPDVVIPEAMRDIDPDFSQIVFEDFAFRLFSTAHRARPDKLATVAPYVSQEARSTLAAATPTGVPIAQVVVGAMRVIDIVPAHNDLPSRIVVEYEANIATKDHTYYSVERWTFLRDGKVHTRPPGATREFPCPNCGAPWQSADTGTQTCASCGQVVDNGRFDWTVGSIEQRSIDERAPTLTDEVPERGTDLPTIKDPDLDAAWSALTKADGTLTMDNLRARLDVIYREVNGAWSQNELRPARPFVSDGLYDYLDYWVRAYKAQGLRNALEDMRITRTEPARVDRDRWYDAVTIRIFATGKDYIVKDGTSAVVRGSKRFERAYSEYWTLVRSAGRQGAPRADRNCPNCGAPLAITEAGACEHCGAHVTAGEFDWVLSKIEQDDTYRG